MHKIVFMSMAEAEYLSLALTIQPLHATKRMLTTSRIMSDDDCILRADSKETCSMVAHPHIPNDASLLVKMTQEIFDYLTN